MKIQSVFTIPRTITGRDELIVMSRKEFERLISRQVIEEEILRLSREAKALKKSGKLPLLKSLKNLR